MTTLKMMRAWIFALCLVIYCCTVISPAAQAQEEITYKGRKRKGIPDGYGTAKWADGRLYKGSWDEGVMEGQGTMTYSNGDVYQGEWENGQKDGRGYYTWKNGDYYAGTYRNGERNGWGRLEWKNGDIYEGYWVDDMAEGKGTFSWADGSLYSGQWKENKKHGQGTMSYADGGIEQGDWENDEYVPCECKNAPNNIEEAYQQSDAVLAGKVTDIRADAKEEGYSFVTIEITQYWKGNLGVSDKLILRAGASSCDFVYFVEGEYLLFLNQGATLLYEASNCSGSGELVLKQLDILQLDEMVPCQVTPEKYQPQGGSFFPVCGCDGQTYNSPADAAKKGIQRWKRGKCK